MAKYTTINRENLPEIMALVNNALASLEEHGISMKLGRVTYTQSGFKGRLSGAVASADGTIRTPEEIDFKRNCNSWGLQPTDLGKVFQWSRSTGYGSGDTYKLVGSNSRSYKFPLLVVRMYDGKTFKFQVSRVQKMSDYLRDD